MDGALARIFMRTTRVVTVSTKPHQSTLKSHESNQPVFCKVSLDMELKAAVTDVTGRPLQPVADTLLVTFYL